MATDGISGTDPSRELLIHYEAGKKHALRLALLFGVLMGLSVATIAFYFLPAAIATVGAAILGGISGLAFSYMHYRFAEKKLTALYNAQSVRASTTDATNSAAHALQGIKKTSYWKVAILFLLPLIIAATAHAVNPLPFIALIPPIGMLTIAMLVCVASYFLYQEFSNAKKKLKLSPAEKSIGENANLKQNTKIGLRLWLIAICNAAVGGMASGAIVYTFFGVELSSKAGMFAILGVTVGVNPIALVLAIGAGVIMASAIFVGTILHKTYPEHKLCAFLASPEGLSTFITALALTGTALFAPGIGLIVVGILTFLGGGALYLKYQKCSTRADEAVISAQKGTPPYTVNADDTRTPPGPPSPTSSLTSNMSVWSKRSLSCPNLFGLAKMPAKSTSSPDPFPRQFLS